MKGAYMGEFYIKERIYETKGFSELVYGVDDLDGGGSDIRLLCDRF